MNKIKIIHLMPDDKFLDDAIKQFDAIPNCFNQYLVYLPTPKKYPEYIKSDKIQIVYNTQDIIDKISNIDKVDGIFIHYYHKWNAEALIKIKEIYPKAITFWIAWGADFYQSINYPLFQKETKKLIESKVRFYKIRVFYNKLKNIFMENLSEAEKSKLSALPLIDYCSPILPNEFQLIKKLKGFRAKQIHYSYSTIDSIYNLNERIKNLYLGNNVLIGNSSTASNNHIEIFKKINRIIKNNNSTFKYIVPLNYGSQWYKEKIIEAGEKYLKDQFQPLTDFLPKEQYFDLIATCNTAIFNHQRQQALGNINTMLYYGARVYLCENSVAYEYFKKHEFNIYSLENDFEKFLFSPLNESQIENNRTKLVELRYDPNIINIQMNNIISIIKEHSLD